MNHLNKKNIDNKAVKSFGKQWKIFDQTKNSADLKIDFDKYFKIFPWNKINSKSIGFDMGCGTGRWAEFVIPYVSKLYCIEPSIEALNVAKKRLNKTGKCIFINSFANDIDNIDDKYFDFGYCLGVFHHIPNVLSAIKSCTKKLKKGAPFLIYIYYNFENRSYYFILLWQISNVIRILISSLPFFIKKIITDLIALLIYLPLKYLYLFLEKIGINVDTFPLALYRKQILYTMRSDSLDRFGTRLEQRFSKKEIIEMLSKADLSNITFSDSEPFWTVLGYKN